MIDSPLLCVNQHKTHKGVVDPESTILAAWIFAEENTFCPETEFEIDDPDMS